jgi:hypothetical protein
VMQRAEQAGARIVKPARKTFWGGYAGYFQDPDPHLWEIAFNPHLIPDAVSGLLSWLSGLYCAAGWAQPHVW